jgi:hypothetical protein
MINALLKGKLSAEQENMEDILTSNVFGLLRYLPPQDGLFRLLARAENLDGARPLQDLLKSRTANVSYQFWPLWQPQQGYPCEPDVVLHTETESFNALIAIEAKYLSGKSSTADESKVLPTDQLAREWQSLVELACRNNATPILIYVTADIACPRTEIIASIDEYRAKCPGQEVPRIYWLSWRQLSVVFRNSEQDILSDLYRLAQRLNLFFFGGMTPLHRASAIAWTFHHDALEDREAPQFAWEFFENADFTWGFRA